MADSITIQTGARRVLVNNDPNRVIEFNPSDVGFARRFYELLRDFEAKQKEYEKRAKKLDTGEVDGYGIPANISEGIAMLEEACAFLRERIDHLFGAGTSQAAFGDANTLDMFEQFFAGIAPFIEQARSDKMARYLTAKKRGRVMEAKSK